MTIQLYFFLNIITTNKTAWNTNECRFIKEY